MEGDQPSQGAKKANYADPKGVDPMVIFLLKGKFPSSFFFSVRRDHVTPSNNRTRSTDAPWSERSRTNSGYQRRQ